MLHTETSSRKASLSYKYVISDTLKIKTQRMFTFQDHNNSPYPPFFSVDLLFSVVFLRALFVFFLLTIVPSLLWITAVHYFSYLNTLVIQIQLLVNAGDRGKELPPPPFCFFSITCLYYCISFTFIQLARVHIHTIYNGKTFMILFYVLPVHYCLNCIGGIMVSVLASSEVDRGFEPL